MLRVTLSLFVLFQSFCSPDFVCAGFCASILRGRAALYFLAEDAFCKDGNDIVNSFHEPSARSVANL